MKTLAIPAYRKGLELVYEVQPDVPDGLIGDMGRLRQIIVNLVGNAIKFTAEGEVILRIALPQGTPCQSSSPAHDPLNRCELHLLVSDTGIGIPAAQQQAIFEPFVQADGSMTRHYGGTGLGLSIAAQLVALMEGRIWVESTVGTGSTFHCTMPFGVQPGQSPALLVSAALHGVKVLVIDDHTTQRHLLQGLLNSWAMRPTLIENSLAALEALRQADQMAQPFAVIILDAHLPGQGSFAVARWLRQQPALATTPLIVLTAATQGGDRQHWQELHGAACVTKPIAPAELWEAMHQAFAGAKHVTLASPQPITPEAPDGRSLRVLLAEDNAINQRLTVRLLEKRGIP